MTLLRELLFSAIFVRHGVAYGVLLPYDFFKQLRWSAKPYKQFPSQAIINKPGCHSYHCDLEQHCRDSPTPRLCVIDAFKIPKPHRCHKCCGPWAHCQNCQKVTTYMVGTVKRQNTSSSERSWRKIAETRQSLFRKSAWSGYAHKMCAVDSDTKRLYSNEMSDRATHFTVFMIMNCPVNIGHIWTMYLCIDSVKFILEVPGAKTLTGVLLFCGGATIICRSLWGLLY